MALEFITADNEDGYFSSTADTDVFVKAGVLLGNQGTALRLTQTEHDVTVQGAVVGVNFGINLASDPFSVSNCTLSVAEGGLVAGAEAARLLGSGNHVTNNGNIMGQSVGLRLAGSSGASTIENFGLISAEFSAVVMGDVTTQAITLKNTGEIAGGTNAYNGGGGTDTIVNRGVMDGNIVLGLGDDVYRGGLARLTARSAAATGTTGSSAGPTTTT